MHNLLTVVPSLLATGKNCVRSGLTGDVSHEIRRSRHEARIRLRIAQERHQTRMERLNSPVQAGSVTSSLPLRLGSDFSMLDLLDT